MYRALSIRQPWAWLILAGHKDIENRRWQTPIRGKVLIHAANKFDPDGITFALKRGVYVPPLDRLPRGGLVGVVEIVDCVSVHPSPWFEGPFGFVLRNPRPIRFIRMHGALGFFPVSNRYSPASVSEVPELPGASPNWLA